MHVIHLCSPNKIRYSNRTTPSPPLLNIETRHGTTHSYLISLQWPLMNARSTNSRVAERDLLVRGLHEDELELGALGRSFQR